MELSLGPVGRAQSRAKWTRSAMGPKAPPDTWATSQREFPHFFGGNPAQAPSMSATTAVLHTGSVDWIHGAGSVSNLNELGRLGIVGRPPMVEMHVSGVPRGRAPSTTVMGVRGAAVHVGALYYTAWAGTGSSRIELWQLGRRNDSHNTGQTRGRFGRASKGL